MNELMTKYAQDKFEGYEYLWMGMVNKHGQSISEKYIMTINDVIYGGPTIYGIHADTTDTFCYIGFFAAEDDKTPIDAVEFTHYEVVRGNVYGIKFPGYANLVEQAE